MTPIRRASDGQLESLTLANQREGNDAFIEVYQRALQTCPSQVRALQRHRPLPMDRPNLGAFRDDYTAAARKDCAHGRGACVIARVVRSNRPQRGHVGHAE